MCGGLGLSECSWAQITVVGKEVEGVRMGGDKSDRGDSKGKSLFTMLAFGRRSRSGKTHPRICPLCGGTGAVLGA